MILPPGTFPGLHDLTFMTGNLRAVGTMAASHGLLGLGQFAARATPP
ncbi:hypothetical protein [Synechococcus sp. CCY9201]|nr:hypothetical protein [Synechococcus sp. CCY9201]